MPADYDAVFTWYWLSAAMIICCVTCIALIILQINSIRWYSVVMNDQNIFHILIIASKREHVCLYGAYILASLCALQCLFNHISNYFPSWYCVYGMAACVILHEAAKTFGYGFFLERAKSALRSTKTHTFPSIFTKYILPIWIFFYFFLYSILCPLTFRGLAHNPFGDDNIIPTSCLFDEYESWVFYVSIGVEVFNSIFFVILFAFPLWKIIKIEHESLSNIIKYNIIFSSISCISSVLFLLYRALSRNNELAHYLWLAGNIDLLINAICTFLMVTANRMYLQHLFTKKIACCKNREKTANDEATNNETTQDVTSLKINIDINTNNDKGKSRISSSRKTKDDSSITNISLPKLTKHSITPQNLSSTLQGIKY